MTQRIKVMIVDDSALVRRALSDVLAVWDDISVIATANDAFQAVAKLRESVPDVILLDIEMPRMDGYEVAQHIRNDPRLKDIPIVMITSRVSEKHRARAIEFRRQFDMRRR